MRQSPTGQITNAGNGVAVHDGEAPLTRPFRDLVLERMERDPSFRDTLYQQALDCIRSGDAATGRAMLRNYFDEDVPDLAVTETTPTLPRKG